MQIIEVKDIASIMSPLSTLLIDCVGNDASIGFNWPLEMQDAVDYWQNVGTTLGQYRKILIAKDGDEVLGAVQLSYCKKANGQHRCEVEKLMVARRARGEGLGNLLMEKLEAVAKMDGKSLLTLDTRAGDVASNLYIKLGFIKAGSIPNFTINSDGVYEETVIFYKAI